MDIHDENQENKLVEDSNKEVATEKVVASTDFHPYEDIGGLDEGTSSDVPIDIENLWKERTGLNEETLAGAIETIIFMNEHPVGLQKIKSLIDPTIPLRVLHEAITRLQSEYENAHHGIRILEVAEGYQFRTKATYSRYVRDMLNVQALQMSPTSLEVLAIIAYKQPISKSDVERIRGVDSSHIIRALMDKRLVKIIGRSDDLGRPTVYATTLEFLEVFNLKDLSELPPEYELQELATKKEVGTVADIRKFVGQGDKTHFFVDELDELDMLARSIDSIESETSFTKTLRDQAQANRDLPPGERPKTAFDLLEEFVIRESIIKQNKLSLESTGLGLAFNSPHAIDPLVASEANWPNCNVDLDVSTVEAEDEDDAPLYPELFEDEEIAVLGEEESLGAALDKAFEDIKNRGVSFGEELEDDNWKEQIDGLSDEEAALDRSVGDVITRAREMGIDLDFLGESSDKEQLQEDVVDDDSNESLDSDLNSGPSSNEN